MQIGTLLMIFFFLFLQEEILSYDTRCLNGTNTILFLMSWLQVETQSVN